MTNDDQLSPHGHLYDLGFDLRKEMMVHAILIVEDFSNPENEYFQNVEIYVGNSTDWTENEVCPGGPHMLTDEGSSAWYYDERTTSGNLLGYNISRSKAYEWGYGAEVWCNKRGRYVHLIADLSHLSGTYKMSLCSVGIMGASYIRDEPLPTAIELYLGSLPYIINVPYIYDEYTAGEIPLNINLRQSSGPLNFVTLSEDYDKSVIEIDSLGVTPGDYELQIESFDSESILQTTLLTETI